MFDFDHISIAVAVILTALSLRQFRRINIIMTANFLLFEAVSEIMALNIPEEERLFPLHASYAAIGCVTVVSLVVLKASPPLYVTILAFTGYNIGIVSEVLFFGQVGIHANFIQVAHSQMIIELLIMFITGVGGLYVYRGLYPAANYLHSINRFFRVGPRVCNRSTA